MEFTVNLGSKSYPIIIDRSIANRMPEILKSDFPKSRFALVTNCTIAKLYASMIDSWKLSLDLEVHEMPDGEQYKTIDTWESILDFLIRNKFERSSVLIALGGGVVGDVAGFAASAFLRGIPFVQIPTTLLAMVDSSVGGKTAVDHPLGKNLIGAFWQPKRVFIDTVFLDTLPQNEFISGYGELFKYGFISGRPMFDFVKNNNDAMLKREPEVLLQGILKSVEAKTDVVSQDEFETKGLRALLNYGHTFAHSLERFYNFSGILHGEAVLWGMKCAYNLGKRIGTVAPSDYALFEATMASMPLPALPKKPDPEALYSMMFTDKKVESGKVRFVVPASPGVSIVKGDIDSSNVIATLKEIFG